MTAVMQMPMLGLGKTLIKNSAFKALWTPAALGASSLALWLDADDASTITLSGSTVSEWRDKSGNARHASQATDANQPTRVTKGLNGRSLVSFDGSNDALSTTAYTSSNQVGWYVVMRLNAVGHYPMLLSKYQLSPSINGIEFRGVETTGFPSITGAANNIGAGVLSPPSVPVSNSTSLVNRFSVLFGLNNVGTSTLHQNGVLIDTKALAFTNASLPLVIGSRQGATNFMNGLVCEVVETSGVTGASTREKIEGYLAWKWGLLPLLPQDHPYRFDGGIFGYKNSDMVQIGNVGTTYSVPIGTTETFTNVSGGFWLMRAELTYQEWYTTRNNSAALGYTFANNGREGAVGVIGALPTSKRAEPATSMSWRDAIVFCNAKSELEGLGAVYRDVSGNVLRNATLSEVDNPFVFETNGYRLPTNNEWEMAARWIGTTAPTTGSLATTRLTSVAAGVTHYWTPNNYASGAAEPQSDSVESQRVAWYVDNSGSTTKTVATKSENQAGLYDMTGNVWEFCLDASGANRLCRGPSYGNVASILGVGVFYNYFSSSSTNQSIGLRLLRRF